MMNTVLKKQWQNYYRIVPEQLQKVSKVGKVATAFNTNIDAVVKMSGAKLQVLLDEYKITIESLQKNTQIADGKDVVRGIAKCFINGIAEEWLCNGIEAFKWLQDNIGYERLQMGGQGGIVANAMAVLGVQKVYAHTASHPDLQAKQFLDFDNLLAADESGKMIKAVEVNRKDDVPLIHWIIEFDAKDKILIEGKEFVCPKANRFIATYDPDNMLLKKDNGFLQSIDKTGFDYMILSGYHNLSSKNNGLEKIRESVALIKKWKKNNTQAFIHLELASTQDIEIRREIIEQVAPLADSVGLNEREALDALEVIDKDEFDRLKNTRLTATSLLGILLKIKEKCQAPRVQLHFFGMYLTLQNRGFVISPEQNRCGMMLAAVVAATKAGTGNIDAPDKLLWAHGKEVADIGLDELKNLAEYLQDDSFAQTGIGTLAEYDIIAVPTILVEKPLTLVGMGDTISSVSLIGAL